MSCPRSVPPPFTASDFTWPDDVPGLHRAAELVGALDPQLRQIDRELDRPVPTFDDADVDPLGCP